jgi:hypothetical protein
MAPATALTVPRRSASRMLGELRAAPAATAIPSGGEAAAARAAAATFSSVWLCAVGALSMGSFCVGSDISAGYAGRRAGRNRPTREGLRPFAADLTPGLVRFVQDSLALLVSWLARVW